MYFQKDSAVRVPGKGVAVVLLLGYGPKELSSLKSFLGANARTNFTGIRTFLISMQNALEFEAFCVGMPPLQQVIFHSSSIKNRLKG